MIDVCDKIHRQLIKELDGNKSWNITMYELGLFIHNKQIFRDHISNTTKWYQTKTLLMMNKSNRATNTALWKNTYTDKHTKRDRIDQIDRKNDDKRDQRTSIIHSNMDTLTSFYFAHKYTFFLVIYNWNTVTELNR